MARPKAFDEEDALDAAIATFREHGFEGTSAEMLVQAMGIGRQSLYNCFGDKWQLYCLAVRRYAAAEARAHIASLGGPARAVDGLRAMVDRVVAGAEESCLGVNSVCEFGEREPTLTEIRQHADAVLRGPIKLRVVEAQADGDVAGDLDPDWIVDFFIASFAGIRVAARGGLSGERLAALGDMAMRALR
ncbi:TetR/AcrR family transcriptional regulator [Flavisphingomonas formosensis]|uniref:TetR/AcrR family transcriptional regulator n=1 Tax=Flavisphingomonas formosensis TaxID=861534 RepID=UPI0012FB4092|nr:TetR/AcrR family transcriptional regulator [Sphingomonas formosensis]